jgi:predicted phosphodiesterase
MDKAEIAKEYREKYGMEMPTQALARVMHKKNPTIFYSVENARSTLRYIEGKSGEQNRGYTSIKNSPHYMATERYKNPYGLPKSYQTHRKTYVLPKECTEILLLSDIHIPYHCTKSLTIALDYGRDKENKINCILLNGDVIDFHRISRHETDMRKRSTVQEFEAADLFLYKLRLAFPDIHIYWLKGNHDMRWEKYLQQYATQIWDDNYFSLESRLKLKEKNISIIPDNVLVMAGKLLITHGHHLIKGGMHPAKRALAKAGQSVIMSHLHRRDYYKKRNATKTEEEEGYVTGCLCELSPDYNVISDSENGFAHISIDKGGIFSVKNYEISKDRCRL